MSEPALRIERDGHVVVLTMNRPQKKNAMNLEMMCRMADAWDEVDADPEVRAVILTGAGGVFSAGADLDAVARRRQEGEGPRDDFERRFFEGPSIMWKALLRDHRVAKPLIAAVEGPCLAGGTEILQATDIRVASTDAWFGLTEVQRGLVPGGGSMVRLPRQMPWCKAMEVLLTGDRIPARDALAFGFVNEVVPPERVMPRALEFAERIARNAPLALRAIKETAIRTSGLPLEEAFRIEHELAWPVARSQDAREGPRAFMEKREPVFQGR